MELEEQLKEAKYIAEDADRKYDEVAPRLPHASLLSSVCFLISSLRSSLFTLHSFLKPFYTKPFYTVIRLQAVLYSNRSCTGNFITVQLYHSMPAVSSCLLLGRPPFCHSVILEA